MDNEKFIDKGVYGNVDYLNFNKEVTRLGLQNKHDVDDRWLEISNPPNDSVNHPAHYTRGGKEAIDIIEEAIQDAPTPAEGMLQAQVLKYLLRLWLKDNPVQDAKKAQWYLTRLIDKMDQM